MRGLLVKDLRLLAGQKRFFLTVAVIGFFFMLGGQGAILMVSYCTLLMSFFTASTISYDEFNHGFFYLFSLPVSRKGYVAEKYLFGVVTGGVTWAATTVIGGIYSSMTQEDFLLLEWMTGAVGILVLLVIFLCLTLPVQFKFGTEKGRIVVSIVALGIFIGMMAVLKMEGVTAVIIEKAKWIASFGTAALLGMGLLLFAALAGVSVAVSMRIMERKQFS